MTDWNNKHLPGDMDKLTRKDLLELCQIEFNENVKLAAELEKLKQESYEYAVLLGRFCRSKEGKDYLYENPVYESASKTLDKFAIEKQIKAFDEAEIPRKAKAGCIGEFNFTIPDAGCCPQCFEEHTDECDMCYGNSDESGAYDITATVPWDLCKSIWLAMNKIKAEELRQQQENNND